MNKRAFIIHGWDGYPEEGWFPWLKNKLEAAGFNVVVAEMPKADEPRINNWIPKIKEIVGKSDDQTYFIGHSMGCQAIVRYLESLPSNIKVGGAVFVAGFLKRLTNLEDEELVRDVAREWLSAPLDLEKVRDHLKNSIAIFSDDDPYVPVDNQEKFANELGSKIIIEHNQKHFSGNTGTTELPIVLNSILELENNKS